MNNQENQLLNNYVKKRYAEVNLDPKEFDTYAEKDNTLTYQENKQMIDEKLNDILPTLNPKSRAECQMPTDQYVELMVQQMKEQIDKIISNLNLNNVRICGIIGDIHSGKTNLAIYHLRKYKGKRKIYTLGYPKQIDNFIRLNTKRDIAKLTDSIIFIDELSKFYSTKERHTNTEFLDIARIMGHSNNTLVFTTQLTQDLTNKMEAFVDTFLITRMDDLRFLKLGSKAKYRILDCADIRMTGHSLNLKQGEYLELSENNPIGENGVKDFPFQNIGKDWVKSYTAIPNNSVRGVALSCEESCEASCEESCEASCVNPINKQINGGAE